MSDRFCEHEFLAWLTDLEPDPRLLIPIGDDAALLDDGAAGILLASDAVVEGTHCKSGDHAPLILARKVVRSNLSDIAAMGGRPESLLLNMVVPKDRAAIAGKLIAQVVAQECRDHGVVFAGGDTVCAGSQIVLAASVTGRSIAEPVRRSGARPGDLVVVTGELGGSILGHHADFSPRLSEAECLVVHGPPSAMADISDGLLRDLANITKASGLGARIEADTVPISEAAHEVAAQHSGGSALEHALHDGEDFELVFTISRERFETVQRNWNTRTKLTVIGEVVESGLWLCVEGLVRAVEPGGFDHGLTQEGTVHD